MPHLCPQTHPAASAFSWSLFLRLTLTSWTPREFPPVTFSSHCNVTSNLPLWVYCSVPYVLPHSSAAATFIPSIRVSLIHVMRCMDLSGWILVSLLTTSSSVQLRDMLEVRADHQSQESTNVLWQRPLEARQVDVWGGSSSQVSLGGWLTPCKHIVWHGGKVQTHTVWLTYITVCTATVLVKRERKQSHTFNEPASKMLLLSWQGRGGAQDGWSPLFACGERWTPRLWWCWCIPQRWISWCALPHWAVM